MERWYNGAIITENIMPTCQPFSILAIFITLSYWWVVVCWCGYASGSRYRFAYGPDDATATLAPV